MNVRYEITQNYFLFQNLASSVRNLIITDTDYVGPSVCLFVRSITQKRMIPKCSNFV